MRHNFEKKYTGVLSTRTPLMDAGFVFLAAQLSLSLTKREIFPLCFGFIIMKPGPTVDPRWLNTSLLRLLYAKWTLTQRTENLDKWPTMRENLSSGLQTTQDSNQPAQLQSWKFSFLQVYRLHFPESEQKAADKTVWMRRLVSAFFVRLLLCQVFSQHGR